MMMMMMMMMMIIIIIIIIIPTVAVVRVVQVLRTQEIPVSNVDPKVEHQKLIYSSFRCPERGAGIASKSNRWVVSVSSLGRFVPRDILIKSKPMRIMQWPLKKID